MPKLSTITTNRLRPIHPGEVLKDELAERELTASAVARNLDVPVTRITEVLNGRRGITADTAPRLAQFFSTSPQFWLNLQQSYDLKVAEAKAGAVIRKRVNPAA